MNQAISDILDTLDADTLLEVKTDIDHRLENKKDEKIRQLADELKKWGISASELNGHAKQSAKQSGVARYRNPDDSSQTWTGKGRAPDWLKELEEKGMTRDDMKIPQ